jgi:hypothetical protein
LPDVPKPEQLTDFFEFCEQRLAEDKGLSLRAILQ